MYGDSLLPSTAVPQDQHPEISSSFPDKERLSKLFEKTHNDAQGYANFLCRFRPNLDGRDIYQAAAMTVCIKYPHLTDELIFRKVLIDTIKRAYMGEQRDYFRHGGIIQHENNLDERFGHDTLEAATEAIMTLRNSLTLLSLGERRAWLMNARGVTLEEMCQIEQCKRGAMSKRLTRMKNKLRSTQASDQIMDVRSRVGPQELEAEVLELLDDLLSALINAPVR